MHLPLSLRFPSFCDLLLITSNVPQFYIPPAKRRPIRPLEPTEEKMDHIHFSCGINSVLFGHTNE